MLNEQDTKKIREFFSYVSDLSKAYPSVALHAVAYQKDDDLLLISSKIHISTKKKTDTNRLFRTKNITAFEVELDTTIESIEDLFFQLIGENGLSVPDVGCLKIIIPDKNESLHASTMLPLERGGNDMNLLVVRDNQQRLHQAIYALNVNYTLKSADLPYESLQELCSDYRITLQNQQQGSTIDITLDPVATLWENSTVVESTARFGLTLPRVLDKNKAKIGFRVLENTTIAYRGSIQGEDLVWEELPDDITEPNFVVGISSITVKPGAEIQYFASYNNHIQDIQWRSDPNLIKNYRITAFQTVDPGLQNLTNYLRPDIPPKGNASDNFEEAIGWIFWMLGFSGLSFLRNKRLTDGIDGIFICPSGGIIAVECTLGILDSEKRSKFSSRVSALKKKENETHNENRLLPLIITSMRSDEVTKDIEQAQKDGCLVWTRESLDEILDIHIHKHLAADSFFDKLFEENRIASDPDNRPFWSSR